MEPTKEAQAMRELHFRYLNAPSYRTVHGSGAYGGLLPNGEMFIGIYNERTNFPQASVAEIDSEGKVAGERYAFDGTSHHHTVIREVECGILMSVEAARSLMAWMKEKIDAFDQSAQQAKAQLDGKPQ